MFKIGLGYNTLGYNHTIFTGGDRFLYAFLSASVEAIVERIWYYKHIDITSSITFN